MTRALRQADPLEARDEFLRQCLEISITDLNAEFIKVPGEIAYWGEQLSSATFAHASAKLAYERERGRMFTLLRNRHVEGKKPLPVDAIEAVIAEDDELYELQLEVLQKDAARMHIKSIYDAVSRKADMLQSLGAKIREERRGEPALRQRDAERHLTGE